MITFSAIITPFSIKCFGNFSKSSIYIRKIPLNPPLQKGEAVGMPGLIEKSFGV